ncbi:MAG: hypothetical protein ACFB0D_00130 [Phormidesmis sp.]
MQLTRKAILLSAVIGVLSGAINASSAKAQRPDQTSAAGLLSRECTSIYVQTFEQAPTVSIGREIFNPTFYITSHYSGKSGYLTCNLASSTPGADYPSHVRLQFGLSDRADSDTRASVTAYVDGQQWGTEILSPRQTSRVWFVEVDSARSISIEVDCLEGCNHYNSSSASQKVYFARAELEFNPSTGSSYNYPSETVQTTPTNTDNTPTSTQPTQPTDSSRRATNSPQQQPNNSGSLGESIRSIGDSIREIDSLLDIFR